MAQFEDDLTYDIEYLHLHLLALLSLATAAGSRTAAVGSGDVISGQAVAVFRKEGGEGLLKAT